MADKSNADSRPHLAVDTPPPQIPRDLSGLENPIPLSPQWLLPKPGDNKSGIMSMDSHFSSCYGNHPDAIKSSGNGEDFHDANKRSIVSRPSFHDAEAGRNNRWHEEEREMNSSVRKDRWRDGERDKETDDGRWERRTEHSSRQSGEVRRASADRWNDSVNRETNFEQRRESKWNTRWGPDGKESDGWREKRMDSGRDGEGSRDKGTPHQLNPGKDVEKERDHYSRPWRPNSVARGRGDSPLTTVKQGQTSIFGRGRGENGSSLFSAGRGKSDCIMVSSNSSASHSQFLGSLLEKPVGVHGDTSALRYNRMKLLDIYRVMSVKNDRKKLDDFIEVPSLTQVEPLEPMAISTPFPEELVVLKGIDKGDIVSSGIPQVTKDILVARVPADAAIPRHAKSGSREDSSSAMHSSNDDTSEKPKDEQHSYLDGASYEGYMHQRGPDLKVESHGDGILTIKASGSEGTNLWKRDEAAVRKVSRLDESSSFRHAIPWRAESVGEKSPVLSKDWKDLSDNARSRPSDINWLNLQKDQDAKWKSTDSVSSSSYGNKMHWQNNEGFQSEMSKDLRFKRQSSEVLDRDRETDKMLGHDDSFISARKFRQQPSPEELLLFYRDPQGQIQGPFSGNDLIGWFEAGYFGIDLQVRLVDAPPDSPFSLLGDVMPHLRMKAKPPPGFSVHKQIETVDASVMGKLISPGNAYEGLESINNGQKNRHEFSVKAQNQLLESLMPGNMRNPSGTFSFPEGVKGYVSSTSIAMSTVAVDPGYGLSYPLEQRVTLEQQGSLPNHLPCWTAKDPSSMSSTLDFVLNSPPQHSKLIPAMADIPHSVSQISQHVDLLSILQTAAEKAPSLSPPVSTNVPTLSSFPDARLLDRTMHSGIDFQSQAGYCVSPQRLQQLNQPTLSPMIPQPSDHLANFVLPEKVPSSGISQDPNLLSMLQHQYLLSQLPLQSQMPLPVHLSLLDKFILMNEHQKQEQHQLLLQQQHLLSRILSEPQSQQQFGVSPYGHLQATGSIGNILSDRSGLHQPLETVEIHEQMEALNIQDRRAPNLSNLPIQISKDVGCVIGSSKSALLAPHQFFDQKAHAKEWRSSPQEIESILRSNSVPVVLAADNSLSHEVMEKSDSSLQPGFLQKSSQGPLSHENSALDVEINMSHQGSETVELIASKERTSFVPLDGSPETSKDASTSEHGDDILDMKCAPANIFEQATSQTLPIKIAKPVEGPGVKKASEKKPRKQKNVKTQSTSEQSKGSSKLVHSQQLTLDPETEGTSTGGTTLVSQTAEKETPHGTPALRVTDGKSVIVNVEAPSFQGKYIVGDDGEASVNKLALREGQGECTSQSTMQTPVQRAWKPAPAPRAKSLLEIQQEEQERARTQTFASDFVASSAAASGFLTPWAGIVACPDHKSGRGVLQGGTNAQLSLSSSGNELNLTCKKSQLHDLMSEQVIAKSTEDTTDTSTTVSRSSFLSPPANAKTQADGPFFADDDFVEAKDMKKSRKKAAKTKGAGVKSSVPVTLGDPLSSIPLEKSISVRQAQKEELPCAIPNGPSLGDFVFWKGDQINSAPAPAWSADSLRAQKPTSLRDILKEQEKNTSVPQPTPVVGSSKTQQNKNAHGSSSWQTSGTSPIKNSLLSTLAKSNAVEELFWGPLDQPKQESKQSGFLSVATSSQGPEGTPLKNASGMSVIRPKASGRAEYTLASSPVGQPSLKGQRDAVFKHSEATDFRNWCERELFRLTGAKDTGFLEFCLKQPTSEAKTLLRENLEFFDPNHEFIDKLLNYKEFFPADVIEIAFRSHPNHKVDGVDMAFGNADMGADAADSDMLAGPDGPGKGGGKKKGKKGKKVSPSVLGFSVVSNRIMMGDIQTVED